MTLRTKEVEQYVSASSPAFRAAFSDVERVVRSRFPDAHSVWSYGLPGWKTRVRDAPPPGFKGTLDPTHISVLMSDGKSGITLHVWNPLDVGFLESRRERLESAGFTVMRGCLRFRRKQAYPVEEVDRLLRDAVPEGSDR